MMGRGEDMWLEGRLTLSDDFVEFGGEDDYKVR